MTAPRGIPPGYRTPIVEEVADLSGGNRVNRIGAFISTRGLGGFVQQLLFAATIAKAYGQRSELFLLYRGDDFFKEHLVTVLRRQMEQSGSAMFSAVGLPDDHPLPLDWLDVGTFPASVCPYPWWYKRLLHRPKLFLMPSMFSHPGHLPGLVALRYQAEEVEPLRARLASFGLREDRWYVAMHLAEEPAAGERRVQPATYRDAVAMILDQGGQVVRIGAGAGTALTGVVDLAAAGAPFDVQCFALSRARFHLATDSGPAQVSSAFKTPTLISNAVRPAGLHACDLILRKHLRGDTWHTNTPGEICQATAAMLRNTTDCLGWRRDQEDDPIAAGPRFRFPIQPVPLRSVLFEPV